MLRRLRLKLAALLVRDVIDDYGTAEDDGPGESPPPRHFAWTVPEDVRLSGFDGFPCNAPPRAESWSDELVKRK